MTHQRRSVRGSALPETALIITSILLLIIGGMRVAAVSYTQIAADAAAFTHARLTGIGDANATAKTTAAVPRVQAGDITLVQGLPPTAQAPTDYNIADDNNRHGGVTMMQPAQLISTVLKSDLDGLLLGGPNLAVTGWSIAPQYLDFYAHENVLGQALNSADALSSAQNYFTNGENVPPYFTGLHFIKYCTTPFSSGPWSACPNDTDWDALGLAEFLDADNWDRTQAGVSGGDAVFKEMLCHQQKFANVAALAYAATTGAVAAATMTEAQGDIATIYSWDRHAPGGYPPSDYTGPGSYPLNPDAGC